MYSALVELATDIKMSQSTASVAHGDADQVSEKRSQASAEKTNLTINSQSVMGLYCMYALVGLVNGFFFTFMNIPICQYTFGPMNELGRTTVQQCNIAPSLFQMPWNFKLFYGILLDRVGFMGTRRRGWIIFGWTMALIVFAVLASLAPYFEETGNFDTYVLLLMAMCAFYIFADVAGDGMTIELTKLEPEATRGRILTTGQMVRFSAMTFSTLVGTVFMNGKSYYNSAKVGQNSTVFSFELSLAQMHFLILACCVPLWLAMIVLLKDPPPQAATTEHAHGARELVTTMWQLMKTKVLFFLILHSLGAMALSTMQNPAMNIISSIASPSTLQNGLGAAAGNIMFVLGVWAYRTFWLNTNWRSTFLWTTLLTALNTGFQFLVIYNAWGVGQNGWFYGFGSQVTLFVQGVQQVLGSQAMAEFSPAGYEASVYEFVMTINNAGISLGANLQNVFVPVFSLNSISTATYTPSQDNPRLAGASYLTLGVNIVSALIVMWCMPKSQSETREWAKDLRWQRVSVGVAGLVTFSGAFIFSTLVSFLSIFPETNCLKIAGGDGC